MIKEIFIGMGIIVVNLMIIQIILDQRKCDKCGKRMYFWQYVVLIGEKKDKGFRVKEVYKPLRHVKCDEDGSKNKR